MVNARKPAKLAGSRSDSKAVGCRRAALIPISNETFPFSVPTSYRARSAPLNHCSDPVDEEPTRLCIQWHHRLPSRFARRGCRQHSIAGAVWFAVGEPDEHSRVRVVVRYQRRHW